MCKRDDPDRRRRCQRLRSARSCDRRFGIVLQDPYLFTGTIADNIRLGTQESPMRRSKGGRAGKPHRLHRSIAGGFRDPRQGDGGRLLDRAKAANEFCPSTRAQPRISCWMKRHPAWIPKRNSRPRSARTSGRRANIDRDRAPALDDPARRPDLRHAQRAAPRDRHAPATARDAGNLLEAIPASVQGSGVPCRRQVALW